MQVFGLIDGYLGLILVFSAMQLPLALWIMKTYFDTIPYDYEEAALVDGANLFQRVRLVIAPLALPGLGAAGIFAFISAWGDFLMPLILLSSSELQMLPLGLFPLPAHAAMDYDFLSALAVLYMLPAMIAFGFARRYFVQTFAAASRAEFESNHGFHPKLTMKSEVTINVTIWNEGDTRSSSPTWQRSTQTASTAPFQRFRQQRLCHPLWQPRRSR